MARINANSLLVPTLLFLPLVIGCANDGPTQVSSVRQTQIAKAIESAGRFLTARQDADGAWRSDVYGSFKDPAALTPLVAAALHATASRELQAARRRGANYLIGLSRLEGTNHDQPKPIGFPIYAAAFSIDLLSRQEFADESESRDFWPSNLARRQLNEELAWQPTDADYGGWGYAKDLPRKPAAGLQVLPGSEANLSATAFAVTALRQAGRGPHDPAFQKALAFLGRCQNYAGSSPAQDAAFNDGGFFFMPTDSVRNKAGPCGKDHSGHARFSSYGSATADGIRALVACGVPETDPRLIAARSWLAKNFRADAHPGGYAADRAPNRNAVYYYYAFSAARALGKNAADRQRAAALAEELLRRQRPDGSWINDLVAMREDDPLVATAFAMLALAACE